MDISSTTQDAFDQFHKQLMELLNKHSLKVRIKRVTQTEKHGYLRL